MTTLPIAVAHREIYALYEIAQTMGDSGFSGDKVAIEVHAAMDQWGTDEGRIFRNLKGLTAFKGMVVRKYYAAHGWGDLDEVKTLLGPAAVV